MSEKRMRLTDQLNVLELSYYSEKKAQVQSTKCEKK
jgi:hypothetical protein